MDLRGSPIHVYVLLVCYMSVGLYEIEPRLGAILLQAVSGSFAGNQIAREFWFCSNYF